LSGGRVEALELEDLEEGHVGVGVNGHRDVEQDAELPAGKAVGEEGAAGEAAGLVGVQTALQSGQSRSVNRRPSIRMAQHKEGERARKNRINQMSHTNDVGEDVTLVRS
jgi:hypothetical protein